MLKVAGTDIGTVIDSGGTQALNGGIASGGMIDGGVQIGNGTTVSTIIDDGGVLYLTAGVASGTIIRSGGLLEKWGHLATGTIISNGGTEYANEYCC